MIIRLGKFEAVIVLAVIVTISFAFAVSFERKASTVSTDIEAVSLPIIMYHNITESNAKAGKYTVTVEEFKADLEYIKEKGYSTVTVAEVTDYVNGKNILPDKPIMITFDDGFESFYTLGYPLLKQFGMKAVVSVIGSVTDKYSQINDHNINYSNLTWAEINEMHKNGLVEFQNHSYNMHASKNGQRKGISKMNGESEAVYRKALTEDLEKAQELFNNNCGFEPTAVAYPYGAKSKTTLDIIKDCGFVCTLGCEEKTNIITVRDIECLYNLGRYNRPSGIKTESFFEKL